MIATLLVLLAPLLASASDDLDYVVLQDGVELPCRVLLENDDRVVYRARRKNFEVPRGDVVEIYSVERNLRTFLEAFTQLPAGEVSAIADLAQFCESHDLPAEARNLWIRVLTLDAENEQAWTKLGGVHGRQGWRLKVRGRFYTLTQLRERVSDWKNAMEIPTAHFLLKTDIAPERALDLAIDLERAYLAYYDMFGAPLGLYVFDEIPEVHVYSDNKDYPVPPTPRRAWFSFVGNTLHVDGSGERVDPGEVVSNFTFLLIFNSLRRTLGKTGSVEPWARRGISQAFGHAARSNPGRASWEIEAPYLPHFQSHAADPEPLRLDQVIRAGLFSFDSGPDAPRFIAQAYTLVHFLVFAKDRAYLERFGEYVQSSFIGKGSLQQFRKILDVDLDQLEAEWSAYVHEIAGG